MYTFNLIVGNILPKKCVKCIHSATEKPLEGPLIETLHPGHQNSPKALYTYLSGIMGNQRLTFFIISGICRDYTTPKRLKVTCSTTMYSMVFGPKSLHI